MHCLCERSHGSVIYELSFYFTKDFDIRWNYICHPQYIYIHTQIYIYIYIQNENTLLCSLLRNDCLYTMKNVVIEWL